MKKTNKADLLYERANEAWNRSSMRVAFRLLLAAARAGNTSAFGTVGQFYDFGKGVKFNERAALYWYRRAYRQGDSTTANNIGCILRDQNKLGPALQWFRRAVKSGDADANLNIAKIYLHRKRGPKTATRYLRAVCKSKDVLKQSKEQAKELLESILESINDPR